MAGQNNQAGGAQPPQTPGGEGDPVVLALLSLLSPVNPAGAVEARRLPPAAASRLLALLVEQQLPGGLVVTTQEEFEQARERSYADGWQDALRFLGHHALLQGEAAIPEQPTSHEPAEQDDEPARPAPGSDATVLAFPPRIPLVRAADAGRRNELMPHRPRPRHRSRPKANPEQPGS